MLLLHVLYSLVIKNPSEAAAWAISLLEKESFRANIIEGVKADLPSDHLIPVASNAFNGWLLVFRRPLLKMPHPKFRA